MHLHLLQEPLAFGEILPLDLLLVREFLSRQLANVLQVLKPVLIKREALLNIIPRHVGNGGGNRQHESLVSDLVPNQRAKRSEV